MSRFKDMFGMYQNVVAGLCSLVVGGADAPIKSETPQQNMCVDYSLDERIWQCRMEEDTPSEISKEERKKQQYAGLQRILERGSMIVDQEVLEAVIHVESRGNVEIGSRGNGCGVMQLTLPAIAGGLSRLYSPTNRHDEFREKYAGAVEQKKRVIDSLTDNYFARLEEGARRARQRAGEIRREYNALKEQRRWFAEDREILVELQTHMAHLQQEREVLVEFTSAIKHGYLLFDPGARKVYDTRMASLRKVKNADKYITHATEMDVAWVNYIGKQRQMIGDVRQQACEVANTELNVVFGDLILAMEGTYFNDRGNQKWRNISPLQHLLFSYNQGRTDYLTKGAWQKGEYYRRFSSAYYTLFDEKPPKRVPLRVSPRIM